LYGSTTATEILWFISLWHFDADGRSNLLTRGWLRGSQRKLDISASKPWQPVHAHTVREPLEPGQIYEFNVEIRPYGILLKPEERIGIKIKSADNDPVNNYLELVGIGHVSSSSASQVSVHHNSDYPSHLLLPITKGNRIGTFISGGKLPPVQRP
jgi:predicted acyl esterase